jgi:hypothetical protein
VNAKLHKRTASAIDAYWQQQIFSGRGVPPPVLPNDDAVVEYVRKTPGAVGYVSLSTPAEGLRVIRIDDGRP